MSTRKKSGAGEVPARAPGPDTFDFDEYISDTSRFPKRTHRVFLDQQSGRALSVVDEEYAKAVEELRRAEREVASLRESEALSLVDESLEEAEERLEDVRGRVDALKARRKDIEKVLVSKSLVLTLEANTPKKLLSVINKAEKEFVEKYPDSADDDMARSTYVLAAQLAEHCVEVRDASGRECRIPGVEGFVRLLERLAQSESLRLGTAFNELMNTSESWSERLDAGFPGGGFDVAVDAVGVAGSEDGSVVGDASFGDVDRGGI